MQSRESIPRRFLQYNVIRDLGHSQKNKYSLYKYLHLYQITIKYPNIADEYRRIFRMKKLDDKNFYFIVVFLG